MATNTLMVKLRPRQSGGAVDGEHGSGGFFLLCRYVVMTGGEDTANRIMPDLMLRWSSHGATSN
jgi:hypothetical protein